MNAIFTVFPSLYLSPFTVLCSYVEVQPGLEFIFFYVDSDLVEWAHPTYSTCR